MGRYLIPLGFALSLLPQVSSAVALLMGVVIAVVFDNPWIHLTKKYTRPLLSNSIIGLGAGMNLLVVAQVGAHGVLVTILGLSSTLLVGWLIGKAIGTRRDTSILVNVGTAICGGSAIAAVSSAIHAKDEDTSVSLGIVFILNAIALFIFPPMGHHFGMSEDQFGLWSALAIHDTSSVVGASMQFGAHALEVGTTTKLVRALWIIPVTLLIGRLYKSPENTGKRPQFPMFIFGFLAMSAAMTWIPQIHEAGHWIEWVAKRTLVATLFLIGAGLSRATLKKVGMKPLTHGVILWAIVATANAFAILYFA